MKQPPCSLNLKNTLPRLGLLQARLARYLGLSPGTFADLINHDKWPKSVPAEVIKEKVRAHLREAGATDAELKTLFEVSPTRANEPTTDVPTKPADPEEDSMLLRRQTLNPAARKHFGLMANPFADRLTSHEDVYFSPDIRYIRDSMMYTARNGGFMAIVGESGSGKTTLLRELEDRIARENLPIILIRPYVLAMEDNDTKGKTLRATHIAEAIMAAVAPLERPRSSPEARFAQLHRVLKESHAAGQKHCLVIDEAHALPIPTLKHLKRFFELEQGFTDLLSIILLGQSLEMAAKLSETKREAIEVVQRCEVLALQPLDARLEDYLKFRLGRVGKPLSEVIDAGGIEALRARLTLSGKGRETFSLLYPLAVGNLLTAAMNLAAEIGAPTVSADVVRGV